MPCMETSATENEESPSKGAFLRSGRDSNNLYWNPPKTTPKPCYY